MQRDFAQKIIKAHRTVSLNSALLLAGLLPLDIRIREAALLYEERKGHFRRVVGDREVERPVPVNRMAHPAANLDLKYGIIMDSAELEATNDQNALHIYTDGSKMEGKVGAALSIWKDEVEVGSKRYRLEPYCTVYQAELLALARATRVIMGSGASEFCIFCDSRAALDSIINNDCYHPLAVEARENIIALQGIGKIIKILWIKAHVGIKGNERADKLAKEAALKLKTKADYSACPVSYIKTQIRGTSIKEWHRRYDDGETASVTKAFFPRVETAYPIVRKLEFDQTLTQLMTGHGGFLSYLYRFKLRDSPACTCDSIYDETPLHIITECAIFSRERQDLETKLKIQICTVEIKNIMKNKKVRDSFITYCKDIVSKVISKNK